MAVTAPNTHRYGRWYPYDSAVHMACTVYGWHPYLLPITIEFCGGFFLSSLLLASPGLVITNDWTSWIPDSHLRAAHKSILARTFPPTCTSISSYAPYPDDIREPPPNETVYGFYVVLTGRVSGIFFSRCVFQSYFQVYSMLKMSNTHCRQAASTSGPSFRKYRTWQDAYCAYLKAYFSDKVCVTPDNYYYPEVWQPWSPSARDCKGMFWERVDRLPVEPSDGNVIPPIIIKEYVFIPCSSV